MKKMSEETAVYYNLFNEEMWAELDNALLNLPNPVQLLMYGFEEASEGEGQTAVLCQALAHRYEKINYTRRPRRKTYKFYPVLAINGGEEKDNIDYNVRIIGWPSGIQVTSLITAIQIVSLQGQTVDPMIRTQLRKLTREVQFELLTDANDEGGVLVAKQILGMAVESEHIKVYIVMVDQFADAVIRYSVNSLPHLVINGRIHLEGIPDDRTLIEHMATAIRSSNNVQ